ncbi:MAG: hypothetical protein PHV74_14010, partial [Dehalococcoidia bacterium]|nr:hypothetical protein [Dehalococcoidia bacterium]
MIRPQDLKGTQVPYRAGYKYVVAEDHANSLSLFLPFPGFVGEYAPIGFPQEPGPEIRFVGNEYVRLYENGLLWFRHGYAWDGCSGPTIDDESNMRCGLYHDGLYQLMRKGYLPQTWRDYADKVLKNCGIADGMDVTRAEMYHFAVDRFAAGSAKVG